MKRATPLGIVLLIGTMTVVPAVLHGRILNRWGVNKGMVQASQSLLALPDQFGDFVKIADQEPLSDRVQRELGVAEHIRGRYSNSEGQQVQLLLLAGQPGPLVRHPPEICYAMSGNRRRQEPKLWQLPGDDPPNQFRVLTLETNSMLNPSFTVTYGFFDGEAWDCPRGSFWDSPRMRYGGKPWLWKIQVLCNELPKDGAKVPEPTKEFLGALVTESFKLAID